ncbi:MAG: flagellar hook-basal body protein [Bacillus sp. (in: firmicutes)]
MNRTLITATNTLSQLQLQMDMIGSNLANAQTTAYKSKSGTFGELLVQQFDNQSRDDKEKGRLTPNGIRQGVGAHIGLVKQDFAQGSIKTTGRGLDVALAKENLFFKVKVNNEIQYTRDGAFHLSPAGSGAMNLVTGDGDYVINQNNQPIVINGDANDISFTENGTMVVTLSNGDAQMFDLGIISVQNPQYLEQKRGNLVGLPGNAQELGINKTDVFTELTGFMRQEIAVQQGALEASNVDMSKELTDLLDVQRQFQLQSRSITIADQMLGLINGVR